MSENINFTQELQKKNTQQRNEKKSSTASYCDCNFTILEFHKKQFKVKEPNEPDWIYGV